MVLKSRTWRMLSLHWLSPTTGRLPLACGKMSTVLYLTSSSIPREGRHTHRKQRMHRGTCSRSQYGPARRLKGLGRCAWVGWAVTVLNLATWRTLVKTLAWGEPFCSFPYVYQFTYRRRYVSDGLGPTGPPSDGVLRSAWQGRPCTRTRLAGYEWTIEMHFRTCRK